MNEFVLYNNLFDIYNKVLTDKQQEIFKLYYCENLSMQEIADTFKVSKSFVGKVIKECINKLQEYEDMFRIYSLKNELMHLTKENDIKKLKAKITTIVNKI